MDARDRRQYPRLEGHFKVDLLNMGDDPAIPVTEPVVPAEALDISKHGLRLESAYNVPVGTLVSVVTYYHGQGSVCICDVVWKRAGQGQKSLYGLYIKNWGKLDRLLERKLGEMEAIETAEREKKASTDAANRATATA
jgi:hypothetical protein